MAILKPSEVSKILKQEIKGIDTRIELEEVGTVLQVGDGIARIHGLTDVKSNELVEFERGSFETELRGWLKPVTMFRRYLEMLCLYLAPSSRILQLLMRGFNSLEINAFNILDTFNFGALLRRLFSEGRRSYIIARK